MNKIAARTAALSIGSLLLMATLVSAQQSGEVGDRDPRQVGGATADGPAKHAPTVRHQRLVHSPASKAAGTAATSTAPNPVKTPPPDNEQKAEAAGSAGATVNPSGDYQPVIHARGVNISTCMDTIVTQSNDVIDRPHTAISRWVQTAPNEHVFESIVGLTNPSKIAPSAVAVIVAAPLNGSKCEGESVQIYPTAQPCGTVQASLIRSGHTVGALQSMPVIDTNDGARIILLPNGGTGCVLVRMRLS